VAFFRAHPRLTKAIEAALVLTTIGLCAWAVVDQWHKAGPRLAHAKPGFVAAAFVTVAVYYLVFILGWIRMLAAWRRSCSLSPVGTPHASSCIRRQ